MKTGTPITEVTIPMGSSAGLRSILAAKSEAVKITAPINAPPKSRIGYRIHLTSGADEVQSNPQRR